MNLMVLGAAILLFLLLPPFKQGLTNTGKNLLSQKKILSCECRPHFESAIFLGEANRKS